MIQMTQKMILLHCKFIRDFIFGTLLSAREAKADIEMDVGQAETETDPGIFCRNSPIRNIVVILRLKCSLTSKVLISLPKSWD